MRRTYRSKKDAGGVLDHRDVLQNMDEKSSAFDAFYIQNIKQAKRELSCVGSSNAYGVASKKVRKRKYVKRIVKEVENVQPRESISSSTYLTPDKSIRVNKILDPFDQLLSTSSTNQEGAASSNNGVNVTPLTKKERKTYTRKKTRKGKKFNYSSDYSTDSDKENSSNYETNTTDIRVHELLIDRELNIKPKNIDESINRIFHNQSLINNFKRKNTSFNTSYKNNRNKWTGSQSPILQKSPLCSTPFKDKYRGKSIYNFSPIFIKEKESPNYVTITEENNDSNHSIVFLCKEKVPKISKDHSSPTSVPEKCVENVDVSMIYENEIEQYDQSETKAFEMKELSSHTSTNVESISTEQSLFQVTEAEPFLGFSKTNESLSNDRQYLLKFIQEPNTENEEPNKSDCYENDPIHMDITEIDVNKTETSMQMSVDHIDPKNNESKSSFLPKEILTETDVDLMDYENEKSNTEQSQESILNDSYNTNSSKNQEVSIISKENTCDSNSSSYSDKESMYDTCESEQSLSEKEKSLVLSSPIVAVRKLRNSVFIKHLVRGKREPKVVIKKLNDSVIVKHQEKDKKEPAVAIERLNDSVFSKYYNKMIKDNISDSSADENYSENQADITNEDSQSDENKTGDDTNEYDDECEDNINITETSNKTSEYDSQSEVEKSQINATDSANEYNDSQNEEANETDESVTSSNQNDSLTYSENNKSNDNNESMSNCSEYNLSETSNNTESDTVEILPTEIIITDSSATEDIESDEENKDDEKHISFVTTRRRNEIANDSMFIFDNSYGSTSTECDKTVLSNKARLSYFEKSDLEVNSNVHNAKKSDTNINTVEDSTEDNMDRIQINNRKSLSKDTDMDSSMTEVFTGEITDNTIVNSMLPNETEDFEIDRFSVTMRKSSRASSVSDRFSTVNTEVKPSIVLQPGKKWERSLSIYRRMTMMADNYNQSLIEEYGQKKGRKYRQSVISTMEMQDSLHNESINSRRSTFVSKHSRPTIRFVKDSSNSRISLSTTEVFDDLKGFLTEECDDTVIELSKLSLADSEFEVTVLDNFHESSGRLASARDYVLRRCNQTDAILFDECYPETVLKNCHKIGEGVYGEVFLWRGRDGRARVMKIVPIAGACKVNGEQQKDFHEVISEIVIAMELSALRAPIADIDRYFDEGKDVEALDLHSVENATDVFNEVLAVRCVQGPYPSRLLDLWELFDECKGSENDNPAALPADQQYMVLELANAGQDLESYQFTGAQQAHALFQQIAFGLAVGEESFQFEHRDLHWGNVLIAPTEQKLATFVLRGRTYRVPRGGVAATIIDYSLSRISLPLAAERAALYNDLSTDEQLFDAVGDYQFQVYRLMRDKLGNDWKNFEPYTNILWLHYTVDKMITALRYKRSTTKIHKHYIEKLKGIKERILEYKSATEYVLTDIEI